jgi:hypothetical protein
MRRPRRRRRVQWRIPTAGVNVFNPPHIKLGGRINRKPDRFANADVHTASTN